MSSEPEDTHELNYHCPMCGELSTLIISEEQAFCTNTSTGCPLLTFNPSLADGGMSVANFVDERFLGKK